ncbi:MAG: transaldolase [Candidatus Marinarcus sp.]|uniref:transaldolase n=1 Tax=Candidatus Marinarcus sp. TaxID=3100987 RepID=UPI003B00D820
MALKEDINFSLWCDFIERDFLENQFKSLIKDKIIQGATSNPAIFESAISNSVAYRQQLDMLQANSEKKIYEELAITDITRASEILADLHNNDADDGFISIEVDPTLCDDEEGTIEEGERLYKTIGNENVMIKVPATKAGYKAMKALTAQGINVNATLVFSPEQAIECTKALDAGIKESKKDIKAVVSVFVSRLDRMCDAEFEYKKLPVTQLGIINATKCYYEVNKFKNKNIRTLFASTGVKSPELSPSYYVDTLIYPNSINTAPLATIENWVKDGSKKPTKMMSEEECDLFFAKVASAGVNIQKVYDDLLNDGLVAFKDSFKDLLSKLVS